MENPLSTETQNRPDLSEAVAASRTFWMAIIATLTAFSSVGLSIYLVFAFPVWQVYLMAVIAAISTVLDIAAIILSRRGRVPLAASILYWSLLFVLPLNTLLLVGSTLILIGIILVMGYAEVFLLFSPAQRKYMQFGPFFAALVMGLIELIQPAFRLNLGMLPTTGYWGPLMLGILVLGVIVMIIRRAWSGSLRTKLLTSLITVTVVSIVVFGYFAYTRTQQLQTILTGELQTTVKQQAEQQLMNTVQNESYNADQSLSEITLAVKGLADYRAAIFSQVSILGAGSYWDGHTRLSKQPGGQYSNSQSDISAVFIPNIVSVDEALITDLNTSVNLDFSAPGILKNYPNMVALYYMSNFNYVVYYPNFDQSTLPPDLSTLTLPWYTNVLPQNDPEKKVLWSAPYQDPAGTGLIITSSAPVYDQNGVFHGVMAADVQLSKITENISAIKIAKSGFAFLIDTAGHIIAMPAPGYSLLGLQTEVVPVNESPKLTLLGQGPADFQDVVRRMTLGDEGLSTLRIANVEYYVVYTPLPSVGYSLGALVPKSEMEEAFLVARGNIESETQNTLRIAAIILAVILVLVMVAAFVISLLLTRPITRLTKTVEEIAAGNYDTHADVTSTDEVGTLATAFNSMTVRLRDLIGTLEQRVVDATRSLTLAAEVGQRVAQVHDLDVLLKQAVTIIREQFGLYYTQVYLLDPTGRHLVLRAGTGEVGQLLLSRRHSLAVDLASLNGTAVLEQSPVIVENTETSLIHRPNPLLPDTRSEMVVPLMGGEDFVLGTLDMQSGQAGVLNKENLKSFQVLAGQLAVAIENASLLAETEAARLALESQSRRLVHSGWEEFLNAVERGERIGYTFDQEKIVPSTEPISPESDGRSLVKPIQISNEPVGALKFEGGQIWNEEDATLVDSVARQLGQQVENLRLIAQADQYRSEAENALRRLTREGWEEEIAVHPEVKTGFVYDLNMITPLSPSDTSDIRAEETLPLEILGEKIGQLSVTGPNAQREEVLELLNSIGDQLSARLENLRLSDQTQSALAQSKSALAQSNKLFEASRSLTQAADLQGLVAAAAETLNIPAINRAVLTIFDYDDAGEIRQLTNVANWWNGKGHEGAPVGTHYPREALSALPMLMSPTPVFFNDMFNDERINAASLALVKAQNLRAVAALPLYAGSKQIGALLLEAEEPHEFTPDEIRLVESLGPQIATVFENRQQYERAQRQAERETMLNTIGQKIRSATSVEAVLQIAARELGRALGAPLTVAQLGMKKEKKVSSQ